MINQSIDRLVHSCPFKHPPETGAEYASYPSNEGRDIKMRHLSAATTQCRYSLSLGRLFVRAYLVYVRYILIIISSARQWKEMLSVTRVGSSRSVPDILSLVISMQIN